MAFDWVYASAAFDTALKDRIAGELVARAAQILALPSLRDPGQASYHNHTLRELALATFALAAVEGHPSVEERARPCASRPTWALDNVLELTDLVNPDGAYHESTDYMRITWEPLAMLAELRRTRGGARPGAAVPAFRNMGTTYLYKALPDGSMARDDDNEYPHLDGRDSLVLGYAVHRFQDPYAAYLLRESGWLPAKWSTPVLEFLWRNDRVAAARSREDHRERAAPPAALPGRVPPGAAQRLRAGRPPGCSSRPDPTSPNTTTSTGATSRSTTAATSPSTRARTTRTPKARTT